jgi:glutamate dehydrogenase/leucine dehydrogenase
MSRRLRAGDTDEHIIEQRQENKGPLGKTKTFMQDWGWAVYLLVAIVLSLGYRYVTPSDEIKAIKTEQGILKDAVEDLKNTTKSQANDISIIVRLQCFNDNYTTKQLNLVGIHCDGIR